MKNFLREHWKALLIVLVVVYVWRKLQEAQTAVANAAQNAKPTLWESFKLATGLGYLN